MRSREEGDEEEEEEEAEEKKEAATMSGKESEGLISRENKKDLHKDGERLEDGVII